MNTVEEVVQQAQQYAWLNAQNEAWGRALTTSSLPHAPAALVGDWLAHIHMVTKILQPQSIGEISVRAGYSAFAMLSAVPAAVFGGMDDCSTRELGAHAHKLLRPFTNAGVHRVDSQKCHYMTAFDLVHINGQVGCMHNILLAERSGASWLLVSHTDCVRTTRIAVQQFVVARSAQAEVDWLHDVRHGSALIRMSPPVRGRGLKQLRQTA